MPTSVRSSSEPSSWDKPYPQEVWDAFLVDLEADAQAYTRDMIATVKRAVAVQERTDSDEKPQ